MPIYVFGPREIKDLFKSYCRVNLPELDLWDASPRNENIRRLYRSDPKEIAPRHDRHGDKRSPRDEASDFRGEAGVFQQLFRRAEFVQLRVGHGGERFLSGHCDTAFGCFHCGAKHPTNPIPANEHGSSF